ncbi:hypothetical protein HispidOSU_023568, partial [Sigmodon hispidus]
AFKELHLYFGKIFIFKITQHDGSLQKTTCPSPKREGERPPIVYKSTLRKASNRSYSQSGYLNLDRKRDCLNWRIMEHIAAEDGNATFFHPKV